MPDKNAFTILVDQNDAGKRLDIFISSTIPDCSRSLAAMLINDGIIRVQGQPKKPSYRLKTGENIYGYLKEPEPSAFLPEPLNIDVIYEDEHLIVINKQAGVVVHPAPGHFTGTLVNGLLYRYPEIEGIEGTLRPGIVHRLDKDTSGLLVVAKSVGVHQHLAQQFKSRTVFKAYLAIVHGKMVKDEGMISLPIGRHPKDRKKMSTKSYRGRYAETSWHVIHRLPEATLLEVFLKTGRTHQIRVHLSSIHHPLLGDTVYGGCKTVNSISVSRQMLHAWRLEFIHPVIGETMRFESPMPSDMEMVLEGFTI